MLSDHPAALIIGDPAFQLGDLDPNITVYDLSNEWFLQTGKTFVHAVVAVREKIFLSQTQKFFIQRAKLEGYGRIREIVCGYKNLPEVDINILENYLENKIKYDLDDVALDGLTHFSNLCYQQGIISKKTSIQFL
jgi:predicted solute-binding protein